MNQFEELRVSRSRTAVTGAMVLWAVAIASSPFAGAAAALGVLMLLIGFFERLDEETWFVAVMYATMGFAVVGPPLTALLADRLGPRLLGARSLAVQGEDVNPLRETIERLSIAAGVEPIVEVAPIDEINAVTFGLRRGRPVIVVGSAVASASSKAQDTVIATALSDAILGRGAGRVWLAGRAPALLPLVVERLLLRPPWWRAIVAACVLATANGLAAVSGSGLGPAIAFALASVVFSLFPILAFFVWLQLLSAVARSLAWPFHSNADLGALSLLRHPEAWHQGLIEASESTQRSRLRSQDIEWVMPRNSQDRQRRIERIRTHMASVDLSLGSRDLNVTESATDTA